MREPHVERVDERDSGWEDSGPRFRVYLHGSEVSDTSGWTDAVDVVGADLLQTIDWAQRQAGDTLTYAVALVLDRPAESPDETPGRGLVWLVGRDGNDAPDGDPETFRRMLTRRREPVAIPPADRMPDGVPGPEGGPAW